MTEPVGPGRPGRSLLVVLACLALSACGSSGVEREEDGADGRDGDRGARAVATEDGSALQGVVAEPEDWRILVDKVQWARARGLDTLPLGEAVARVGLSFVGTAYEPGTLERWGTERTVVNLRALDCVTFVETVLATVRVLRDPALEGVSDPDLLAPAYAAALERMRYRDGVRNGYASRLHYFSEWIRDAAARGLLREVTPSLGGIPDAEPLTFMSSHPAAYPALSAPEALAAIRRVEAELSREPRTYLPQGSVADAAPRIRNGDVIAATSTVEGLDVAHTGLALWRAGRLHLLHAPLVGDSVQVSSRPLATRLQAIGSQDGILVARPLNRH